MGWFNRNEQEQQSSPIVEKVKKWSKLLLTFNIAAAATVILPLFMFMIARLARRNGDEGGGDGGEDEGGRSWWWWGNNGEDGGDGEGGGWWWWGQEERREEERGGGALVFCYLWSLLVFGAIVWHANQVIDRDSHKTLLVALFMFANLAFLCCILTGSLGVRVEGREAEEYGWLGQFPAAMVLTFLFWFLFGAVFSGILYTRGGKRDKSSSSSDYQQHDDNGFVQCGRQSDVV